MDDESIKQKRTSRKHCCVFGCRNTYQNSEAQFYKFPTERWHAIRREKLIQAVKRNNPDGSPWVPKSQSIICSNHFAGGKKSNDPSSPAYIPTLHLGGLRTTSSDLNACQRYERFKRRAAARERSQIHDNTDSVTVTLAPSCHVGIQVDLEDNNPNTPPFMLCATRNNCSEVQVSLPRLPTCNIGIQDVMTQPEMIRPKMTNTATQISQELGFTGFNSITKEETLKELSGTTFEVFQFLCNYLSTRSQMHLCKENRLLLFLMKMKLGLRYSALGALFRVHRTTASTVFKTTLSELYEKTKASIFWPDSATIKQTMPKCFKSHYPNCTAIIDCTEIFCDRPKEVHQRVLMFSNYKSNYTLKYLIAITPAGYISFVSCGFGGRSTDSYITVNSGILQYIKLGDQIMADKGFPTIKSNLDSNGAVLIMPPFAHRNGTPFTVEECEETYHIASVRIHVERAIQRMKLQGILKHLTYDLIPDADKIVTMAAVLANLQPPIISQ